MSAKRGRVFDGPFAAIPVDVLTCVAVRTLPNLPFRVLVALAAGYYRGRNGSLSLTRRAAKDYGIGDSHGLDASLRELEERGLIACTRHGTRVPPRSALFALGWIQVDEPLASDPHDARPTVKPGHAYGKWKPAKQGQHWNVKRRAARFSMRARPTALVAHAHKEQAEISGACPQGNPDLRVAHAHPSQYSIPARRRLKVRP